MPLFIQHRVNRIVDLETLDGVDGVEIDIRSIGDESGKITLHHDPWVKGDCLDQWLEVYIAKKLSGPLILNTKEDGLEGILREKMSSWGIVNYFFLDTTIPTLYRNLCSDKGDDLSIRRSLVEHHPQIEERAPNSSWIWMDCFHERPLAIDIGKELSKKFKICLVSPELHGQNSYVLEDFIPLAEIASAICTKQIPRWRNLLES